MDPGAKDGSRVRFVLAMAPRLVTLRIPNGPRQGLPISLIQHILSVATRLQRLDMQLLIDYKSLPTSAPFLPTFGSAHLLPLQLGCILDTEKFFQAASVTASKPPAERLWALFESRDEGAVAAVSALRPVGRVVLEPWLVEGYPGGEDYAVEKMKEKGLELRFDTRDPFAHNW
ncbi:hypothetical protein BCR35DRAFT_330105 [Leucosporidium creatinivorum]|uniref:Uncharacterized protein n=1 Tax=Leucosporidium creatinivorum TaxID=106004 RepID=A0A1Y2G018_9BASI|nr:hypothetical protein BCR35DRAFT_330105 [Leucosporidium creatinivorum]